jgi:squalene-associated FAD-dependent desaturase
VDCLEDLGRDMTAAAALHVAVIGAGWAGCSAAAALARSGHRVTLLEASGELGGRARRLVLELGDRRHVLDNGQHLLIGAYTATAQLLVQLGIALDAAFLRIPFRIESPDGFALRAARLPAPWHLVAALGSARGLSWRDRLALATLLPRLRAIDWTVAPDRVAEPWLHQLGQTPRLIERLWRPLTLAALNTPIAQASAQTLATVLRDSLGAAAAASDMWLPRSDLSATLPEAVERQVTAHGGAILRHARVDLARRTGAGWTLAIRHGGDHGSLQSDALIYAAPASYLQRVFGLHAEALQPQLRMIERFRHEPITTVYLKYAPGQLRLSASIQSLPEDPARRHWGQWVFDRGALDRANADIASVVISTDAHGEKTLDDLCEAAALQLAAVCGLPAPLAARAIVERRATLACVPDLERPATATALSRLALAGDWTASEYPCTLETAVRSGQLAAQWVTSADALH